MERPNMFAVRRLGSIHEMITTVLKTFRKKNLEGEPLRVGGHTHEKLNKTFPRAMIVYIRRIVMQKCFLVLLLASSP